MVTVYCIWSFLTHKNIYLGQSVAEERNLPDPNQLRAQLLGHPLPCQHLRVPGGRQRRREPRGDRDGPGDQHQGGAGGRQGARRGPRHDQSQALQQLR